MNAVEVSLVLKAVADVELSCVNANALRCNRNKVSEEQFNDSVNEVEEVAQTEASAVFLKLLPISTDLYGASEQICYRSQLRELLHGVNT